MLLKQIICYFAAVMKCPFYIFLLLCGTFWFASCTGPVILEEKEESGTQTEQEDTPNAKDTVAIVHEGSYSSPYSIAEAQTLGRGKSVWIEGYIVGCVSGSMKNGCNYTPQATTLSNILLADTFPTGGENDYQQCLPIELPNNSIERDELNLYDNPDNYHRKVRLQGDITLYYKVVGMKEIVDYIFEDENDNENENEDDNEDENVNEDEPNKPHDPNATRKDTLSIAESIEIQKEEGYEHVYIKGYIIGYTTTKQKVYYNLNEIGETKKTAKTNVILADNLEERDIYNMIAVELKEDSYIQQAVNLVDNPQNFHKRLTVKGATQEYKGFYGCTNIPNGLKLENDTIKDYYFLLE